jgi:hypothetical protein
MILRERDIAQERRVAAGIAVRRVFDPPEYIRFQFGVTFRRQCRQKRRLVRDVVLSGCRANPHGRLKDRRRVATRCDRCPKVFLPAIALATLIISWL